MNTSNDLTTQNQRVSHGSGLRVLFVSHAYVVGVNQGKLNAIAQNDDITVGLLVPNNWKAMEWNRLIPVEHPYSNIQIYSLPALFSGRGGAYCYNPWSLFKVLNDFQPDIVQVEEEVFSLLAFEVALWVRLWQKPMIVFGWENMERCLPVLRRWVRDFVMATTQLFIAGNSDGAKVMSQWDYQGLIEVMPQIGVDTQLFTPQLVKPDNNGKFRIGFLGRLATGKGVDLLLSSLYKLRCRGLECQVILCGSGPCEASLKQQAEDLQVSEWIIWRGGVRHEQAPQEIANFDVLVLPSRSTPEWKEQFGHVLIEAMAMGIPVIGSSSGEIPNVIGRPDLVFPENDVDALTAILEKMMREPEWWQEAGQYCFDRTHEHYSHTRIAERLINLWKHLSVKNHNICELSGSS
ncbi:glycosyltransferase family 4 protein [Nostoc sp. FACHB-152]|uniref:glycosyltransferase n=1 Tax=unclassified Nostoc TaxID=2593658 RepID=UPI0016832366|nr:MULTISPECIES: glycosyltransferase [unclassified Nostoc]MBD2445786.1 glycosyltransferase family 4 protein [Nostoc sp. FACHB-152]MBD2466900.1 glycosyltransferase family 4 protein [Nostoc sp. FACHB-145]